MIEGILKRRAIKQYVTKLPLLLLARYGRAERYTPGQVRKTVEDCGLDQRYIHHAYAILLSTEEFNALVGEPASTSDFNKLRSEVAKRYYGGEADFSDDTVMSIGSPLGGSSDAGNGGGDS